MEKKGRYKNSSIINKAYPESSMTSVGRVVESEDRKTPNKYADA
jgi:hypothetical protein